MAYTQITLARSFVKIETPGDVIAKTTKEIERIARISHQTKEKITENSHLSFVENLIARGHDAALEFGPPICVTFTCSRAIANEIVRHRLASYMQESTRFVNYSENVTFILPRTIPLYQHASKDIRAVGIELGAKIEFDPALWADLEQAKKPPEEEKKETKQILMTWIRALCLAHLAYRKLLELGEQRQISRDLLPHALKTELAVQANVRQWRHIIKLRSAENAHPEMRFLVRSLAKCLARKAPTLFQDLVTH